jgi:hypothetical protein
MFCGGCFRDNALVAALRQLGHSTLMVPLYLPLTLDEPDQSQATPIFFGGINVYLEQKSALFAMRRSGCIASSILQDYSSGRQVPRQRPARKKWANSHCRWCAARKATRRAN